MHLRGDSTISVTRRELDARIWWAHYSFERVLSTLTGRPSSDTGHFCSVPLPHPLASEDIEGSVHEAQSGDKGKQPLTSQESSLRSQGKETLARQNLDYYATAPEVADSASYLRSIVNVGDVTQLALSLYSIDNLRTSWEVVQSKIARHCDELDAWAAGLPEGLNFFHRSNVSQPRYVVEQNTLAILYYSNRILITRPCLCRFDRRLPDQTASSDTFSRRAALACVGAARSVAELLPEAVLDNLVTLHRTGPWWQMVHIIMQAFTVLCLEIALDAVHFPDGCQSLVPFLKKLLCWLRVMRATNSMAVRAYSISLGLLKKLTSTTRIVSISLHICLYVPL